MRSLLLFAAMAAVPALSGFQAKKVVAIGISPAEISQLRTEVPGVKLVTAAGPSVIQEISDADAVLGTLNQEQFRAAKKLKWLHVHSAGVENALFPDLVSSSVVVTNARNVYGPQIADHAMAFLLTLTRKLNTTIPAQSKEEWPKGREGMYELDGKTAVVIGVGGIGSNIAQRAHGFGMKVIGVDVRDLPTNNYLSQIVRPERLNEVLPLADVVFISAPHTKKTERMMGTEQFNLLRKGTWYIAVSRGKVTDTGALVKALDEGRLAGAGLDVVDPEPLPKGHPLWKFPNVVITPHTAGGSDNLNRRLHALLKENLSRFSRDEPLVNVVDKAEGF